MKKTLYVIRSIEGSKVLKKTFDGKKACEMARTYGLRLEIVEKEIRK